MTRICSPNQGTVNQRDHVDEVVDVIDYGDTIQIIRDPNAGFWKYVWVAVLFTLLAITGYQIIELIVQLTNEETGTKMSFENLNLTTFQEKFSAKICFESWPSNHTVFSSMFEPNVTHNDDKYWKRDWIVATFLLRPNELGWVIPKTMLGFNDTQMLSFSQFVHETGNITVFESAGYGGLRNVADIILSKFYKVFLSPQHAQVFKSASLSPHKPIAILMQGPSHQLCVRHPTTTPSLLRTISGGFLGAVTDEQFQSYLLAAIPGYKDEIADRVKFVNWLFTFYGGGKFDTELTGNHFYDNKEESSFHKINLKRYEYLNTAKRPCKTSKNVYPPGFAQTICQNECWISEYTKTFQCNKSSLLDNFESINQKCVVPLPMMNYSGDTLIALENNYTNGWLTCVFEAGCHKRLFCTEWKIEVEEFKVHPFRWMCTKEDGEFNSEYCDDKNQIFLFSSQVEVVEEYRLHSILTVLSDSGGQIGLWVGLSVLELAKLIFFWMMKARTTAKLRSSASKSTKQVVVWQLGANDQRPIRCPSEETKASNVPDTDAAKLVENQTDCVTQNKSDKKTD